MEPVEIGHLRTRRRSVVVLFSEIAKGNKAKQHAVNFIDVDSHVRSNGNTAPEFWKLHAERAYEEEELDYCPSCMLPSARCGCIILPPTAAHTMLLMHRKGKRKKKTSSRSNKTNVGGVGQEQTLNSRSQSGGMKTSGAGELVTGRRVRQRVQQGEDIKGHGRVYSTIGSLPANGVASAAVPAPAAMKSGGQVGMTGLRGGLGVAQAYYTNNGINGVSNSPGLAGFNNRGGGGAGGAGGERVVKEEEEVVTANVCFGEGPLGMSLALRVDETGGCRPTTVVVEGFYPLDDEGTLGPAAASGKVCIGDTVVSIAGLTLGTDIKLDQDGCGMLPVLEKLRVCPRPLSMTFSRVKTSSTRCYNV